MAHLKSTALGTKALIIVFTSCLILTGCGVDKEAEAQALRDEVEEVKLEACRAWTSGMLANGDTASNVIMSEAAAQKFAELAAKDSTYVYASKAAYTLTAFNGRNLSNIEPSLKPLVLLSLTDIKRVCLG